MAASDPEFARWKASLPKEEQQIEPEVGDHLSYIWFAWTELKSDRQMDGYGNIGPIHYSTISDYARDHGISGQEFLTFKALLKAMDDEYLTFERKNRKKPTE